MERTTMLSVLTSQLCSVLLIGTGRATEPEAAAYKTLTANIAVKSCEFLNHGEAGVCPSLAHHICAVCEGILERPQNPAFTKVMPAMTLVGPLRLSQKLLGEPAAIGPGVKIDVDRLFRLHRRLCSSSSWSKVRLRRSSFRNFLTSCQTSKAAHVK